MLPLKYVAIILPLLSLLILGSCLFEAPVRESRTICIAPYIPHEGYCCLDQNNNTACDFLEVEVQEQVPGTIAIRSPVLEVRVRVSHVLDGDSVVLEGGQTLSLVGIDAPKKGQFGYSAALRRLQALVEGKEVGLEKDREGVDSEGRLVRYLWVEGVNVNVLLVREGLAQASIAAPNVLYEEAIREAEKLARRDAIGLWAPAYELDRYACDDRCLQVSYFNYDAFGDDCENLNGEHVWISNFCPYECDLSGWTVSNGGIHTYSIRNLTVRPNEYFVLFTGDGNDTDIYRYWDNKLGICDAVWNNDAGTLFLRNRDGELMLKYSYFDTDPRSN